MRRGIYKTNYPISHFQHFKTVMLFIFASGLSIKIMMGFQTNRDSNEFISHGEKKHAHNFGFRTKVLLESCETIYH